MESPNASSGPPPNPIIRLSTFIHHHFLRFGTDLVSRLDDSRRSVAVNWPSSSPLHFPSSVRDVPFASVTQANQAALSLDGVAKTLAGTSVYTVSNSSNEFVLMSEPNGAKSIGLLCFRQEDAEAFLSQVRLNKGGIKGHARVVPITLDQVYMLKVEGIAFRFMPDPVQIKNALELKASDVKSGFDGVPVFQSDILVVKKKNKRYCPIYFRKEDIEQELSTVSRSVRGSTLSQQIMVGSLEDVLKKMETNEKGSGWEDLIFIPPGKSRSQHIQEIGKAG